MGPRFINDGRRILHVPFFLPPCPVCRSASINHVSQLMSRVSYYLQGVLRVQHMVWSVSLRQIPPTLPASGVTSRGEASLVAPLQLKQSP